MMEFTINNSLINVKLPKKVSRNNGEEQHGYAHMEESLSLSLKYLVCCTKFVFMES